MRLRLARSTPPPPIPTVEARITQGKRGDWWFTLRRGDRVLATSASPGYETRAEAIRAAEFLARPFAVYITVDND